MINNKNTYVEWKIQLIMRINELFINELFETLLRRYQDLETRMDEGSDFVFESIDLLYYNFHRINLNRGGSYIDSPDWIK